MVQLKRILRYLGFTSIVLVVGIVIWTGIYTWALNSRFTPYCYPKAAVAADHKNCSVIGRDILKHNGSVVDAAIAALLCVSVFNPHNMGIGGGVVFTIYNATTGKVETIDARETAPMSASTNTFDKNSQNEKPGLFIAVPGELRGYEMAHQRYGRLPWKELFEPIIKLASNGINVGKALAEAIEANKNIILNSTALCEVFCGSNKTILKENDIIKFPKLVETYNKIAEEGADAFYKGSLTQDIVDGVKTAGGIITYQDLENYQPVLKEYALNFTVGDYRVYAPDAPFGGPVLALILNILEGYNMSSSSMSTANKGLTFHRMIEAFRAASDEKHKLEDLRDKTEIAASIRNMISDSFAEKIKSTIDDKTAKIYSNQEKMRVCEDSGTSHLSIIAEDGSAVSVSSSINYWFGSKVMSKSTGIIFNNQMCDFKYSGRITPKERPPSSICPTIILDKATKEVKMVVGASGGLNITTSIAQVILNYLFFKYNVHEAVNEPRVNSWLNPSKTFVEKNFYKDVIKALTEKNHTIMEADFIGKVQAVVREQDRICSESDYRKGSEPAGY